MKAEKDKKTGKWLIQFRYTDWQGVRRKINKTRFRYKTRGLRNMSEIFLRHSKRILI